MRANLLELYQARELLYMWTRREVLARYKQSMLGAGWAILQPLAMMLVYVVVFTTIVKVDTGGIPYPIFAYTALVPWTFFSSAISTGVPSLVTNMGLVTKIYFPREVLPMANIGARLVDFLWASLLLVAMLILYHAPLTLNLLWLPLLLLIQIVLTVGVVLFAAALNVSYRDVGQLIPLIVQIWLYASPVIYSVESVPVQYQTLYYLNPMAGLIGGYRSVLLLGQPPDATGLVLATIVSLIACVIGYVYFKKVESTFADII